MNDRSTEALLARRALAEKATPGPWEAMPDGGDVRSIITAYNMYGLENCKKMIAASIFGEFTHKHIAANSPQVVMADIDEILRLRAEVERLNKEADWLAWNTRDYDCPPSPYSHIDDNCMCEIGASEENCAACWRRAARATIEERLGRQKPDA